MRTISGYITYSFKDKDPIIDELRTIIQEQKLSYDYINHKTGVSASCLYSWFHGKTRRPQHATVKAVVAFLGYEYKLVKVEGKKAQLKVIK